MKQRRHCSLDAWLAWQEKNHPKKWDLGLDRIRKVWQTLGSKRLGTHIVIVAGTNGKGSCVRWCEALAVAHGISVATFTSPHLLNYRERIRFDGEWVSEQALVEAFSAIDQARGEVTLTYFEWAALAAFYLFAQRQPQLVVLEVGLGGRLDASNLIDADAAIITRIGLDHLDWLGKDITSIAREKAGVMRAGQLVACADAHPPRVLLDYAENIGAQLWLQGDELHVKAVDDGIALNVPNFTAELPLPQKMPGKHQYAHLAACIAILAQWFPLQKEKVADVITDTTHAGRLMWYHHPWHKAAWLLDVAHNQDSAEVLHDYIEPMKSHYQQVWCLCGMLCDKAHEAVFTQLEDVVDKWVLCGLGGDRGSSAEQLARAAQAAGISVTNVTQCIDSSAALDVVSKEAQPDDLVIVMGSFVTVTEIMEKLNNE